jgi:hypothetical protein
MSDNFNSTILHAHDNGLIDGIIGEPIAQARLVQGQRTVGDHLRYAEGVGSGGGAAVGRAVTVKSLQMKQLILDLEIACRPGSTCLSHIEHQSTFGSFFASALSGPGKTFGRG